LEGVHLEPGFEVKIPPVVLTEGGNTRTFVFACPHFALERLDLTEPTTLDCDGERFFVLSQIEGEVRVACGEKKETLRAGQSCLLPATAGPVTLTPGASCALLKAYVPDLMQNVVLPLRQAGIAEEAIVGLGGQTRLNALRGD
jgi:mannose-6-phosphate isomerase